MPKPIELSITRRMSTPLQLCLVAAHLPAPVRQALEDLVTAQTELGSAERELASATGTAWVPANDKLTAATTAAETTLTDFAGINAASSSAIRDSAAAAFDAAMVAATDGLRSVLDALADADRAAQLWHAVKSGKPVLRYQSHAGTDSEVHKRLGVVRSELRDQLSQLPDSID